MGAIAPIRLDRVVAIARDSGNEQKLHKLLYNLRFVSDLTVYEELFGPPILVPEEPPQPENISPSDWALYEQAQVFEEIPDNSSILRYCKVFTVLQTKSSQGQEYSERRAIQHPRKVNQGLQETVASDIELRRPEQKTAQIHLGTSALCEDLVRSFHQVELDPRVRDLFGIRAQVGDRLLWARVRRLPMGFSKAADLMNIIVQCTTLAITEVPQEHIDVHIDNVRLIHSDRGRLLRAKSQFRRACSDANISLNDDPESQPHSQGKYCGVEYDYVNKTVHLSKKFVAKLRQGYDTVDFWNFGELQKIFGRLYYGAQIMRAPVWNWYRAIKFHSRRMASAFKDSDPANIWPCARPEIMKWLRYLIANEPVHPPDPRTPPALEVYSDSSQSGWGVVIHDKTSGRILAKGGNDAVVEVRHPGAHLCAVLACKMTREQQNVVAGFLLGGDGFGHFREQTHCDSPLQ